MREVLKKLESVQEIDNEINAILYKKNQFPARLSAFDGDINANTAKYEEKKKIVDELDRSRRQQLGALELNEERAKRSQEKLEQIKTNQEYQALLKEIESLKKNSAVIQENANKVTEELERHKKEMMTYEAVLTEAKSKRDVEAGRVAEEDKVYEAELAKLRERRRESIVGIDARYLATYDRVRASRQGIGIVAAIGGSCKGCNMRIPPQIYNELQKGNEIHLCPSCRRILVYKEPSEAPAEPAAAAHG